MELKYLGTAAAEAFPAFYCDCDNCRIAKQRGGKNIRARSQALIDNKLLIDFPCDTYWNLTKTNTEILNIRHCLITHTHTDHFYPVDMGYIKVGYTQPPKDWSFTVYGNSDVGEPIFNDVEMSNGQLIFQEVEPFKPFTVDRYTVTALKAEHKAPDPYFYMISCAGKTILYAHDTDYFPQETWDYLASVKPRFDLVSFDCTGGAEDSLPYKGHLCMGTAIACREELVKKGYADEKTVTVLNHFSHNGKDAVYDVFQPLAEKEGFVTSYDGLTITI